MMHRASTDLRNWNETDVSFGSKSDVLTVSRLLPVYPDQRTFSEPVGMAQRCQKRKWASSCGIGAPKNVKFENGMLSSGRGERL